MNNFQISENDAIKSEIFTSQPSFSVVQELHSGPLPSAAELEKYKNIIENAPERILKMAEKYQDYEIAMGRDFVKYKLKGQSCAMLTILSSFTLTAFLAYINQPVVGGLISGATIASVALAFIYGERAAKKQD